MEIKGVKDWTQGKHALLIGGSGDIGYEISKNLTGQCRKITLVARNYNKLEQRKTELVKKSDSHTVIEIVSMDINNYKKMKELINKIYLEDKDQIDIFINCAGGCHVIKLFEDMSYSDIETIFDTNAKAPMFWLRELLPYMKNNKMDTNGLKRGHILTMSSRSSERPLVKLGVYAAAKGAVDNLVEAVRKEYSLYRLVLTLIAPGSINTAFTSKWPKEERDAHNSESMSVEEAVLPILQALRTEISINKVSLESAKQWQNEPGVLSS